MTLGQKDKIVTITVSYHRQYRRYNTEIWNQSTQSSCGELKWIYTKKERLIISMGGGYGVPFHLGLSPAWFLHTHHTNTLAISMHARNLQDYNRNTATYTLIAYCLLLHKQGACSMPSTLRQITAQTTPHVTTLFHANLNLYLLEYWTIIDYQ